MRSVSTPASGFRSTAFTAEKIALSAPMPSTSVRIATVVNPGERESERSATRRVSMVLAANSNEHSIRQLCLGSVCAVFCDTQNEQGLRILDICSRHVKGSGYLFRLSAKAFGTVRPSHNVGESSGVAVSFAIEGLQVDKASPQLKLPHRALVSTSIGCPILRLDGPERKRRALGQDAAFVADEHGRRYSPMDPRPGGTQRRQTCSMVGRVVRRGS